MPTQTAPRPIAIDGGFRLTGRHVFVILCCFFGLVFTMNFIMARLALSTFRGEVVSQPYQKGLKYNQDIMAARAQNDRGWRVEGALARDSEGRVSTVLSVVDRDGAAVSGLDLSAVLEGVADRKRDQTLSVVEIAPGRYAAKGSAEPGTWELAIVAKRGADIVYQSRNRVILQ